MDTKDYLNKFKKVLAQNILQTFTILVLLIIAVIQGFFNIYALRHQQTIIIPATVKQKMAFSGVAGDTGYVTEVARWVVEQRESYTEELIEEALGSMMIYVDPSYAATLKQEDAQLVETVKQFKYAQSWWTTEIVPKKDKEIDNGWEVHVWGYVKRFSMGREITNETGQKGSLGPIEHMLATLRFRVIGGRLFLVSYTVAAQPGEKRKGR